MAIATELTLDQELALEERASKPVQCRLCILLGSNQVGDDWREAVNKGTRSHAAIARLLKKKLNITIPLSSVSTHRRNHVSR